MSKKLFLLVGVLSMILSLPAQVEEIKIMNYNLMFYKASSPPCNHNRSGAQRDADLKLIFQSVLPDVFVVQELGTNAVNPLVMLAEIMNTDTITRYARAASSNNSSSQIVNMMFYNQNKLVLHEQRNVAFSPNNVPLLRIIDFYRLYVKDQALGQAGVDTVFFTIGVAHFKAGNSASDEAQRLTFAQAVMQYYSDYPEDNYLMAGDFNVYRASEPAFQHLINYPNDPSLSLNDPINALGSWNNNGSFAAYHTQSTRSFSSGCFSGGGMDDRFDFILASDAIINGSRGLSYKRYRTYGQDGSSFNGNLATNNNLSVNPSVATALYNFSDHLPVIMELEASVSGLGSAHEQALAQSWAPVSPGHGTSLEVFFKALPERSELSLELRSLDGHLIAQWAVPGSGSHREEFQIGELPAGLYLLSLYDRASGHRHTQKWMKS